MSRQREVVVITGASGGIGRATARRFGADGARVALMARGRRGVLPELRHHKSNVHVSMVQLPGVNTTQFTWSRTKLPKQTMPVPPIYQPEIAADAIHYAAHHKRRQIYVGIPTVMNILGERIAPWLLDRYLARSGFSSQMTDEPLVPQGHDNLFEPVDENRGSHGPFDEQAHGMSPQYELIKPRGTLLAGLGAAAAGAGVAAVRSSR